MFEARDSQRRKVYNLDGRLSSLMGKSDTALTLDECRALVAKVYGRYVKTPPEVRDGRRRRAACYEHDGIIRLPRAMRTVEVVLHECAHGLATLFAPREAGHGPTFARILLDLVHWYADVPLLALKEAARQEHVKLAPARTCAAPKASLTKQYQKLREREKELYKEWKAVQAECQALHRQMRNRG